MELQKRRQEETNERKNAVEAYVYSLRGKLADSLAPFATEAEATRVNEKLNATEVGPCFLRRYALLPQCDQQSGLGARSGCTWHDTHAQSLTCTTAAPTGQAGSEWHLASS